MHLRVLQYCSIALRCIAIQQYCTKKYCNIEVLHFKVLHYCSIAIKIAILLWIVLEYCSIALKSIVILQYCSTKYCSIAILHYWPPYDNISSLLGSIAVLHLNYNIAILPETQLMYREREWPPYNIRSLSGSIAKLHFKLQYCSIALKSITILQYCTKKYRNTAILHQKVLQYWSIALQSNALLQYCY